MIKEIYQTYKKIFRNIFLLPILIFGLQSCNNIKTNKTNVKDGNLTLNNVELKNNIIEINGEANFYWKKFLTVNEINRKENIPNNISIDHSWNNQPKEKTSYSAIGFGTYHFKIKFDKKDIGKSFIIRPNHVIAYASEIFIKGKLVSHNGYVGKSKDDPNYKPARNTSINTFVVDSTVVDVVIWVANFSHFRGGIFSSIELGEDKLMIKKRESDITYDISIIISLLIMFFYHIIIYFVNKKEYTSLFFSFTSLVFALDLSFQGPMCFFLFFPNISFEFSSFLHLSLIYLLPSSFIFFLYSIFPKITSLKIRNFTGIVSVVLISITLFNISEINGAIVKPHFIYIFFILFYILYISVKALISKSHGGVLFFVAYLVFLICAINDLLSMFEVIQTTNLISYGLIVFVFLLSILQGQRSAKMRDKLIKLSNNLEELNIGLEKKVDERTNDLKSSHQRLKKLNHFQESMTNMIAHDLKGPISQVINVENFKKELSNNMIKQAGYKMYNLVQNMLDVYTYENAELKLEKEIADFNKLINSAYNEIEYEAMQKNISFDISQDIQCMVFLDIEAIKRVLVNLFTNAIKFSPINGVINVKIKEDKNNIHVSVSNEGPSIPEDMQSKIFNIFKQAEKRNHEGFKSTGIGLAYCKMAIEIHNGTIGVTSKVNQNVNFWFKLPEIKECFNIIDGNDKTDVLKVLLNDDDKLYLKEYAELLIKFQVFEISEIMKILNQIKEKNTNISAWCKNLENAVFSSNIESYKELLSWYKK